MTEPLVIGIDPSFSALGISDGTEHAVLSAPPAFEGEERAASTRRRAYQLALSVRNFVDASMLRHGAQ